MLPFKYNPLGLVDVVNTYQTRCAITLEFTLNADYLPLQEAEPAGSVVSDWLTTFLPFAEAADGANLFLDLRGGPLHGCVRAFEDDGVSDPIWANVTEMLERALAAIIAGTPVDQARPIVEDGFLMWEP